MSGGSCEGATTRAGWNSEPAFFHFLDSPNGADAFSAPDAAWTMSSRRVRSSRRPLTSEVLSSASPIASPPLSRKSVTWVGGTSSVSSAMAAFWRSAMSPLSSTKTLAKEGSPGLLT